ncbi:MAG TPA: DUF5915 domain-containing protein, partial [Planctomycetota bacterium]|nr:DUF5915 domain-containing protein [Planctomycetota bacterium]
FEAIEQHGVDAVRLLLLGSGGLHLNRRFDPEAMSALRRQVIVPLVNCLQLFAHYANPAEFDPRRPAPASTRHLLDRWIRSRAATLAKTVASRLDAYDLPGSVAALSEFVDAELSNWYVRRSRRRLHLGAPAERDAGLETLRHALGVAARCLAPVAPFAAEMLWHRLHPSDAEPESVHLQPFPSRDEGLDRDVDPALERAMDRALVAARLARALREKHRVRTTVPLASLRVIAPEPDAATKQALAAVGPLLAEEVNVDRLEFASEASGVAVLRAKPHFPVLGKRAGKAMRALQQAIEALPEREVARLRDGGTIAVEAGGSSFEIGPADVRISAEALPGLVVESDAGITVALDVQVDASREARGIARELASLVNQARRDGGFALGDRCIVVLAAGDAAQRALAGIDGGDGRAAWLADVRAAELRLAEDAAEGPWISSEVAEGPPLRFRVEREGGRKSPT